MTPNKTKFESLKGWSWVKFNDGGSFIQSDQLFKAGFSHGFFSKYSSNKHPRSLAKRLGGCKGVQTLKQIHSNLVIDLKDIPKNSIPKADGLFTTMKAKSIWVYSSDCIPIFMANTMTGSIAACHAGWKGIVKNITMNTLKKFNLSEKNKQSLIIVLGPAISKEHYQVDINLAKEVFNSIHNLNNEVATKDQITWLLETGIITLDENPNKVLLDIRKAAFHQLSKADLGLKQIISCPLCTYSENKLFHSWRREHLEDRQWSGIISKG